MSTKAITSILNDHGVPYFWDNGNIYADSMISGTAIFEQVENVTSWSRQQLYIWLGY